MQRSVRQGSTGESDPGPRVTFRSRQIATRVTAKRGNEVQGASAMHMHSIASTMTTTRASYRPDPLQAAQPDRTMEKRPYETDTTVSDRLEKYLRTSFSLTKFLLVASFYAIAVQ